MTVIAQELFLGIYDELKPLFHSHWLELGPYQDRMPLSPNLPVYTFLESSRQLVTFTARDRGRLIGYLIAKTGAGLHYSTTNQAITDIPYVLPEYRGRGIVIRLFRAAEAEFVRQKVGPWFASSKVGSPLSESMGRVLRHIGMVPSDLQFSKWIE